MHATIEQSEAAGKVIRIESYTLQIDPEYSVDAIDNFSLCSVN